MKLFAIVGLAICFLGIIVGPPAAFPWFAIGAVAWAVFLAMERR